MIAAALALAAGDAIGPRWIDAVDKARLPYGPVELFDPIALSTQIMGPQVFVTYRDMAKGNAVAAYRGGQWQKWIKS